MEYSIPHQRELSKEEKNILTLLFRKEKPEWLTLIERLKIIARCGCGKCPTVFFGSSYDQKVEKGALIIDYQGTDQNNTLIGISIFGTKEAPTQLEFWSIDGLWDLVDFPILSNLEKNC